MFDVENVELRLLDYGPSSEVKKNEERILLDPDLLIAIEGIGTVRGIGLCERFRELTGVRRDLLKFASDFHRESTRRGHSSLTTSLTLQFEVRNCSRVASMLLVSPPFGSYLQESQRRRKIGQEEFLIPRTVRSEERWRRAYEEAIGQAYDIYSWMIDQGVEIEDARYILPLSSKTSFFACGSLETFLGFIINAERFGRDSQYYPEELSIIGEKIRGIAERIAPRLTEARLRFKAQLPTYPHANPYRVGNEIMGELVKRYGGDKPTLLNLTILVDQMELVQRSLEDPAEAHTLNPLINAVFLEPMSLAAYHQSIRHRTIPTAIESIYFAINRCLSNQERNLIIPPRIMNSENFMKRFNEAVSKLLETYKLLVENGVRLSDAVYLTPQALKVYAIRSYNAFNFLWPQGYIALRTCSYSQWEVRELAYAVQRRIVKEIPWLGELMGERCKLLGYCPERKWCPIILKYMEYDDEQHKRAQGGSDR